MIRVSSNTTIFWKLFVPILYFTFFGLLGLIVVFNSGVDLNLFSKIYVKVSYVLMYLSLLGFLYFTVFQIKRVEMEGDSFIATNYFKTYRYSINDIADYKNYNFGLLQIHSIHLKAKGKFGKKIRFIPYKVGLDIVKENYQNWRVIIDKTN